MKTTLTLLLSVILFTAAAQQRQANNKAYPGPAANPTIGVTGLGAGLTPEDLVAALVGPGITYSNVSFTGVQGGTASASAGLFTSGVTIFGIDEGVMLSSGRVANALGPNVSEGFSAPNGLLGDSDLEAIFGTPTFDACILEFDFVSTSNQIYIQYVLGSEEYNEYVNYADCFAFFLDGVNIALIPGSNPPLPVSVGTVNLNSNAALFINNSYSQFFPNIPFDIEADGFTKVFTATGMVVPGQTHHVKLAIADKYDEFYDSWIYLKSGSFSNVDPEIPTLSEWGLIILGLTLLAFGSFYILRMKG